MWIFDWSYALVCWQNGAASWSTGVVAAQLVILLGILEGIDFWMWSEMRQEGGLGTEEKELKPLDDQMDSCLSTPISSLRKASGPIIMKALD